MAKTILSELGADVTASLSTKPSMEAYKSFLDTYLANNKDKYFTMGPLDRPIFSTSDIDKYLSIVGITKEKISHTLKNSKSVGNTWRIMNNPFNVANVLATRHFEVKKQDDFVKLSQWFLIVSMYPSLHYKYFKYGTHEACMNYTISNLSGKYKIRQTGNMWTMFTDLVSTAYSLHKSRILTGEDNSFIRYIQDVHTRLNSIIRNIASEYYKNFEDQRYLKTEHENYDEDKFHEATSNTQVIQRLSNKVVTTLSVNGPDMKLVQLSAKTNQISVNQLRTYTTAMINESNRGDIQEIVEALLYLYLNSSEEHHTEADIGTNDFMIYCLKVYKRSNTTDVNVVKIKGILDRWLSQLGVAKKSTRIATIINFRRAVYTFFVMSIMKVAR